MRRKYRLVDAGGRQNNCMILSVIAGAKDVFGVRTSEEMNECAREIRAEMAELIAASAGTELGGCAFQALRVLHEWKTANPREVTSDVSCPSADRCMHIETEEEALRCVAACLPMNMMLGAIELPFLKVIAARKGVHVIEATLAEKWFDLEAWVDAQLGMAPPGMRVSVIVSDAVHYMSLQPANASQPVQAIQPVRARHRVTESTPSSSQPASASQSARAARHRHIALNRMQLQGVAKPKRLVANDVDWAFLAMSGFVLWCCFKPLSFWKLS